MPRPRWLLVIRIAKATSGLLVFAPSEGRIQTLSDKLPSPPFDALDADKLPNTKHTCIQVLFWPGIHTHLNGQWSQELLCHAPMHPAKRWEYTTTQADLGASQTSVNDAYATPVTSLGGGKERVCT